MYSQTNFPVFHDAASRNINRGRYSMNFQVGLIWHRMELFEWKWADLADWDFTLVEKCDLNFNMSNLTPKYSQMLENRKLRRGPHKMGSCLRPLHYRLLLQTLTKAYVRRYIRRQQSDPAKIVNRQVSRIVGERLCVKKCIANYNHKHNKASLPRTRICKCT